LTVKAITSSAGEYAIAITAFALIVATTLFATGLAGGAFAAGLHADGGGTTHGHGTGPGSGSGQHHSFGSFEPAAAAQATRTVDVTMRDMTFDPQRITVEAGETVRFAVRNDGQLVHEFNVGTSDMHAEHQRKMAMMAEHGMLEADKTNHGMMSGAMDGGEKNGGMMMHDDPNSVLVDPGQTGEVVLTFNKPATLQFACNVPGHYEAGMVGTLDVTE